jgi:hypothetical protein
MNKLEQSRYSADLRIQQFNIDHATLLSTINEYADEKSDFDTTVAEIATAAQNQTEDTTAITGDKALKKAAMIEAVLKFEQRACVKAQRLNLHELELALDKPLIWFQRADDEIAVFRCTEIKNLISNNIGGLTNISPADITAMETAITDFINVKEANDQAVDVKKATGTMPLPLLLDKADKYKVNMGKLIHSYLPQLADEWDEISKIGIPQGVRHTSIVIHILDSLGGMPLKDVKCTITDGTESFVKKSTKKGWVRVFSLPNALWNITAEFPNYETGILENIKTDENQITRLEINLQKKSLNGGEVPPNNPENTTGSFLIKCLDKLTSQPKGNLLLTIPSLTLTFDSDEDGEFFGDMMPPGSYTAYISGEGIATLEITFAITAGDQTELTFLIEDSV